MSTTVTRIQPIQLLLCRDPLVWTLHLQLRDDDLNQLLTYFDQPICSGSTLGISRETLAQRLLTDTQISAIENVINRNLVAGVNVNFRSIVCAELPAVPKQHLFKLTQEVAK